MKFELIFFILHMLSPVIAVKRVSVKWTPKLNGFKDLSKYGYSNRKFFK